MILIPLAKDLKAVSRCIELRKVGEEIWRIKINVPDNKKGQKRPLFFKSDNLQKA